MARYVHVQRYQRTLETYAIPVEELEADEVDLEDPEAVDEFLHEWMGEWAPFQTHDRVLEDSLEIEIAEANPADLVYLGKGA